MVRLQVEEALYLQAVSQATTEAQRQAILHQAITEAARQRPAGLHLASALEAAAEAVQAVDSVAEEQAEAADQQVEEDKTKRQTK